MTKDELVASAKNLPSVTETAALEYSEKRQELVSQINTIMASREDIEILVGHGNLELMKDNHANHGLFIESMLKTFDPNVLVETILWVFRAYKSRNFHDHYWAAQLNTWTEVIDKNLSSKSAQEVLPLYHWMIINIPQFSALTSD